MTHKTRIDELGGPTKVAELMGILSEPGSIQRISNWKRRGIPPKVVLQYPELFLYPIPPSQQVDTTVEAAHG